VHLHDGLVPPSTAVARAVREAAEALKRRGAAVVDFTPPGLPGAVYDWFAAITADGAATGLSWIGSDPIDPSLALMRVLPRTPAALRRGAAAAVRLTGEHRIAGFLHAVGEKTVAELWALTARMRAARGDIIAHMAAERIDLVLCPAHATPALPHGHSRDFALAGSPSMLWNAMQFPAGVVPVTRVRSDEAARSEPRGRMEKQAAAVDRESAGLPVGVQVVGKPWKEDAVLAAMVAIEEAVSGGAEFPMTPVE
jgi:fatty acid amide hydrolase